MVGYEGLYLISCDGQVKSLISNKLLKPNRMNTGYLSVELFKDGKSKRLLIHRLVAQAFIANPDNLPQVNHIDEVKSNNCVSNLEWCTAKYNMNYGTGAKTRHSKIDYRSEQRKHIAKENSKKLCKKVIQLSKDNEYISNYQSIRDASRALNIDASHISDVCKGKRKSAGGFIWKLLKEE